MKKKGRYVVEAAFLVPWISILLVYMIFFTLYAHDYAVCAHTILESGIKGSYADGRTDDQIEEDVKNDLVQKLSERVLWLQSTSVEVHVDPSRLSLRISGSGSFLPVSGIEIRRDICRVWPCETLRRSRWMRE